MKGLAGSTGRERRAPPAGSAPSVKAERPTGGRWWCRRGCRGRQGGRGGLGRWDWHGGRHRWGPGTEGRPPWATAEREGSGGGQEEVRESGSATVRGRKKRTNRFFLCNGWQWWVISIQLHVYVHNRSFWSCKRGAPKLQQKMNYNSRVLELHRVLELACLARKLFGAAGIQLQSHAKQALRWSTLKTLFFSFLAH